MKRPSNPTESLISARIRRVRRPPQSLASGESLSSDLRLARGRHEHPVILPEQTCLEIRAWLSGIEEILRDLLAGGPPDARELRIFYSGLDAGIAALRIVAASDCPAAAWIEQHLLDSALIDSLASIRSSADAESAATSLPACRRIISICLQRVEQGIAPPPSPAGSIADENTAACLSAAHDSNFATEIGQITKLDALCQQKLVNRRPKHRSADLRLACEE